MRRLIRRALACTLTALWALTPSASWAQDCQIYGFNTKVSGFDCGSNQGEICFVTNASFLSPYWGCEGYVAELEYPSGAFIYTDLGDFYLHSLDPMGVTVLRHEPELIFDLLRLEGCVRGVIQQPGAVFTLRVVNPAPPHDVVSSHTFAPEDVPTAGSPGGSVLLSSLISPSGPLLPPAQAASTGQRIVVEGRLIVDTDYTFGAALGSGGFLNGLNMGADASIEVQSGVSLRLEDAEVRPCGEGWDRILAGTGGALEVFRSRIEGAEAAVEMEDGSRAVFFAAQFSGNGTGVGAYGNNLKTIDLNFWVTPFLFNSISQGERGLDLEHVELFALNGGVSFWELEEGIRLDAAGLDVSNVGFFECGISLNAASYTDLLRARDISSWGGQYGILSSSGIGWLELGDSFMFGHYANVLKGGSQAGDYVRIQGNNMALSQNNIGAITLSGKSEVQFNPRLSAAGYNVFLLGLGGDNEWAIQHNDKMEAEGPSGRNVLLGGMQQARVFRNPEMTASLENIWVTGSAGALVGYNTLSSGGGPETANIRWHGSPLGEAYCNTAQAGGIGLRAFGDSAGADIRGNDFRANATFGLAYGSPGSAFAATGPQHFKGNLFPPSSLHSPKAANFSPSFIAEQSQYLVGDPNQGGALYPYFFASYLDWFQSSQGSDYACPPGVQEPAPGGGAARLKEAASAGAALLDAGVGQAYGPEIAFGTELKLFRHLRRLVQMGELPPELLPRYAQHAAGDIGRIAAFEERLAQASSFSEAEEEAAEAGRAALRAALDSMGRIQRYEIEDKYFPAISAAGQAEYLQMEAEAKRLLGELAALKAARRAALESQLDTLAAINAGIGEGGPLPLQNLKSAHALLLKRLAAGPGGFSPADEALLESIAQQCAHTGGEGVLKARILLAERRRDISWPYEDECLPAPSPHFALPPPPADEQPVGKAALWPNPAEGAAFLSLPEGHDWRAAALFSAQGQQLRRILLQPGQRQAEIPLAGLAPGLYFVKIEGSAAPALRLAVAGR
jgi:hypothetical protein